MISTLQNKWQYVKDDCPFLSLAVLSNPVFVLHIANGILSILRPNSIKNSMFDTWIIPHLDVHADDEACRLFTIVMVLLQLVIYRPDLNSSEPNWEEQG